MMEEQEPPLDVVTEEIDRHAEESRERWVSAVALSTAILAALAAVTSMLSGHHANEAMLEQIRAADQWAQYQANSIKFAVLASKVELLQAMDKPVSSADLEKVGKYSKEKERLPDEAKEKERSSEQHLKQHLMLARGVTMFQIAISVAAIAVLTRRKWFWYLGLALGCAGTVFLVLGVLATS